MNKEIELIFKDFKVDEKNIPIAFIKYFGNAETYITYQSIGNKPALFSDDKVDFSINQIDIDIYTKSNYLKIEKEIKKKMKEHDFVWIGDSSDMYETDTEFYHKTYTFEKERIV